MAKRSLVAAFMGAVLLFGDGTNSGGSRREVCGKSTACASFGAVVCKLARGTFAWYAREPPNAPARALLPVRALCTDNALPMIGQRRAMVCKLLMAPPPGAVCCMLVLVDSVRNVAGDVLFKNGHKARD